MIIDTSVLATGAGVRVNPGNSAKVLATNEGLSGAGFEALLLTILVKEQDTTDSLYGSIFVSVVSEHLRLIPARVGKGSF